MPFKIAFACLVMIVLAGCEDPDRYPLSGQACSPDDPVHDLSVDNCAPGA